MRRGSHGRPGKSLVLFALLLPALLGLVGLVIDTGLLLAAHRQAQSAADAAALAAAHDLCRGKSLAAALATAADYGGAANSPAGATVTASSPPTQGAYAGNAGYVEVVVRVPVQTAFLQVVGASAQVVQARAVAGVEARPAPDLFLLLDGGAVPGLALDGGSVQVFGSVAVASAGAGLDQNGAAVDRGLPGYGVSTGTNGALLCDKVCVVGGVDRPERFQPLPGGSGIPLRARCMPNSDPFLYLPAPTTALGAFRRYPDAQGRMQAAPQAVSVVLENGASVSLLPGVYSSISVTGAGPGTLTFQPGVYVLLGGAPVALNIDTGGSVQGSGVLFYNTGSNYDVTTGLPDAGDGNVLGNDAGATFGGVQVQAGSLSLTPLAQTGGPLDGLLFYQRRWNTQPVSWQGAQSTDRLAGSLYARWAPMAVKGPGGHEAQLVASSLTIQAPSTGTLTFKPASQAAKANQAYLVE